MAGHEDHDMLSPSWNGRYDHIETQSQPQPGFENIDFANLDTQRLLPPWAPLFASTNNTNAPRLPVHQYSFHDFRSAHIPSDAGTGPSDSGFGGEIHRPPTYVTGPSVQGDDTPLSPDTQRMDRLMSNVHLSSDKKTRAINMQTGRPSFACTECKDVFETNSKLKKHLDKHFKPHKCDVPGCGYATIGFASPADLNRHFHQVHDKPGYGKKYLCHHPECRRRAKKNEWRRSDNFRNHLDKKHNIKVNTKVDLAKYEWKVPPQGPSTESMLDGVGTGATDSCKAEQSPQARPDTAMETNSATNDTDADGDVEPPGGSTVLLSNQVDSLPICSNFLPKGIDEETAKRILARSGRRNDVSTFFSDAVFTTAATPTANDNTHIQSQSHALSDAFDMLPTEYQSTAEDSLQAEGSTTGLPTDTSLSSYTETAQDSRHLYSLHQPSFNDMPLPLNTSPSFNAPSVISTNYEETNGPLSFSLSSTTPKQEESFSAFPSYDELSGHHSTEDVIDWLSTYPAAVLDSAMQKRNERPSKPMQERKNTPKQKSAHECTSCDKVCKRPCELRKHMRRHERPYGCTVRGCGKRFGSKNDWKRHEYTQHGGNLQEFWACNEKGCEDDVFLERDAFKKHAELHGLLMSSSYTATKVEECRLGTTNDARFWCGFCQKLISLVGTVTGPPSNRKNDNYWNGRCDHIDSHLFGKNGLPRQKITDWIFLEDYCRGERRPLGNWDLATHTPQPSMGGQQTQHPASRGRTASDSAATLDATPLSSGSVAGSAKRKGGRDRLASARPAKRPGGSNPWRPTS